MIEPYAEPTGQQLNDWQRLTDAATPGPWCYYGGDLWRGTAEALAAYDDDPENAPDPFGDEPWPDNLAHIFHGDPVHERDAEFIAAAREAMPVLLAEHERYVDLRGDITLLTEDRDDLLAVLRRVTAQLDEWDRLSKGETMTTRTLRAKIAGSG